MTVHSQHPELFQGLPLQRSPEAAFMNLYTLIPYLMELYPEWLESDVCQFIEEKTGCRMHPEDQITLRAVYQRCFLLRREFSD